MLIFPAFQDRIIVLAAGLLMTAGLAYIVNRMKNRTEVKQEETDSKTGKN
jgi:hypothetical protein